MQTNKIDIINIGLIFLSAILAVILPFELFLFAYGVLGPLHYLTEISWLHDKNYFATNKNDIWLLVIISLILAIFTFKSQLGLGALEVDFTFNNAIIFIAFGSSLFFALVKNKFIKVVGVILVVLLSFISDRMILFFSVFLPTLIHVFLFTSIFMLYGALKSKSKMGYLSVLLHIAIPLLFIILFSGKNFLPATAYAQNAYKEFQMLNQVIINMLNTSHAGDGDAVNLVFQSSVGISVMRFIAFAYTYHYLNWFSKTKVIGWYDIPKSRALFIVVLWIVSVALYAIDYSLGFKWLFLLSFMHVLLEFPLNFHSFVGIFKSLKLKTATT
ncbi:MAG: hypothetical protein R2831_11150 [Chitinophagaceae bacterium]